MTAAPAFAYPASAALLDMLPDAVMVVEARPEPGDDRRRLVLANAAARALFRLQPSDTALSAAITRAEVLEAVDQALLGRVESEASYETQGVQPRFWRAIARPVPSEDAKLHALLIMRDETDLRRTERMRADFLANASHELRTPLASLVGFLESLRGHARDDPEARERFLEIMTAQAWRMTRLVDDLLSLSRIEMSEHVPPSGRVDLAAAARDLVDANVPLLAKRDLRLESVLPHCQAQVRGDRDQILQVLQNLFDNAVNYAAGTVRLEVQTVQQLDLCDEVSEEGRFRHRLLTPDEPAPGGYTVARVSDDGPGIARAFLPRLSERFYRVKGSRSGTGLGLAIVKHVMNRHRGALMVESVEGKGSTFRAFFPVAAGARA